MQFKIVKKRNRSGSGLLAKMFLDWLDKGLIMNRAIDAQPWDKRRNIKAPRALRRVGGT